LTGRLKQDPATRRIAVLLLTGYVTARYQAAAFAAGCDSFVSKPCLPDALAATVEELVRASTIAPADTLTAAGDASPALLPLGISL
jgi:CheY-like chemotaxis protein